jgi:hypothetical protein
MAVGREEQMSPNIGSSKFIVTILGILVAGFLAYMEKDVPELVLTSAIAGYHAANAYIKGKGGEGTG